MIIYIFITFTYFISLRLFKLFKSFNLKLLVIFNKPVHWLLRSHYCVVGLHGNHVNGNLDGHNLSPCIRIIVLYVVTNFRGCYVMGLIMQICSDRVWMICLSTCQSKHNWWQQQWNSQARVLYFMLCSGCQGCPSTARTPLQSIWIVCFSLIKNLFNMKINLFE